MAKRILFAVCICIGVLYSQESLSKRERDNVLKAYPPSEKEKYTVRQHDTVIRKGGERISCTVIRFDNMRVSIRYEGLKIDIPKDEIENIILSQDLFQVYTNRLDALEKQDFDAKYSLAKEGLEQAEEDQRFKTWAVDIFQHCASVGNHVPSLIQMGNFLSEQGKYPVAALHYKKAVDVSKGAFPSVIAYAQNLRDQRLYFKAEEWYKKAVSKRPEDPKSLEGLAFCFLKQDRFKDAKKYYDRLFAAVPDYEDALAGYGLILGFRGEFFQALKYCSKALSREDPSPEAYKLKGMLDYSFGFYDSALKYFNKALAFGDPSDEQELRVFGSVVRTIQGSFKEGENLFKEYTTEEILSKPDVANAIGYYHLKKGMALERSGDRVQAVEEYMEAEKAFIKGAGNFDENYFGLYALGVTYLQMGKQSEGVRFLNKAYKARKDYLLPKITLAQYYIKRGDYASAFTEYKSILETVEEKYQIYSGLIKAADDDEIKKYAAVLRKRSARNLIASFIGAAKALILQSKMKEASALVERLRRIIPKRAISYDYLGYIAFVQGNEKEALRYFKTGKDIGSSYSRGKYAQLLLAKNQREYLDDFNREDSKDVRNNWLEQERGGVDIQISDNKLLFEGRVTKSWLLSICSKNYPSSTFVNVSVNMMLDNANTDFFSGICIMGQKSGQGIFLVRNAKGNICFSSSDLQNEGQPWKWFNVEKWPSTGITTLAVKQVDRTNRKFRLIVNDRVVKTLMSGSLIKEEYFKIGCLAQADRGSFIRVWYDDMRVITEKQ